MRSTAIFLVRCVSIACAWAIAGIALTSAASTNVPVPVRLVADRGDLVLSLSDGSTIHGAELTGAVVTIAGTKAKIVGSRIDPEDPRGEIRLFDLRVDDSSFCARDPKGEHWAIAVSDDSQPGGVGFTCTSGAVGKCIRFGYAPWRTAPDGKTALAPYHAACTNLVRAAYGGPDRAWTRDGMAIDVYDDLGIQTPDTVGGDRFEAGFGPDGAVCVAHPRVREIGSLDDIVAAAPHLADRIGPHACTEEIARRSGALVFVRSAP